MKKSILIIGLLITTLLFSGCVKYGQGEANGIIFAVDDGVVWDKVWFKTSTGTSREDCYLINDNSLKTEFRKLNESTKVKIYYNRHLFTIARCPDGTSTDDEIYKFEVLQ